MFYADIFDIDIGTNLSLKNNNSYLKLNNSSGFFRLTLLINRSTKAMKNKYVIRSEKIISSHDI